MGMLDILLDTAEAITRGECHGIARVKVPTRGVVTTSFVTAHRHHELASGVSALFVRVCAT
jgi:hypothetical protein